MSRRQFLTASAGLAALALAGCGGSAAPASSAAAGSSLPPGEWQHQWDGWVDGAKKEGKLVLATGPSPDARVKVPEAFKKAFGVDVEYLGSSTSELANRLRSEEAANQFTVDVSISGASSAYATLYPEKMVVPIKPYIIRPDVLDPSMWASGKGVWYMDPGSEYFVRISNVASPQIGVATEFLKPDGLTSWQDLLKPEYKGKAIVMDPSQPGSGSQTGAYLYKTLGEDWARRFYVDQQPGITADERQLADAMVRGKYPIGVGLQAQEAVRLKQDGFKFAVLRAWPDAPGYTSAAFGILGLFRNPPHPNAAKLFLNWVLTREGQIAWNSAWKTASVRTDVDNSWVPDFIVPKPGVKYLDAYDWDYAGKGVREVNDWYKTLLAGRPTG